MDIRHFFGSKEKDIGTQVLLAPSLKTIFTNSDVCQDAIMPPVIKPKQQKRPNNQADYDRLYDKKRCRLVQSSWTETFTWLETNENKTVMWCKICKQHPKCADVSSNVFSDTGVPCDSLRLPAVKAHDACRKHKDSMSADLAIRKPNSTLFAKYVL